MPAGRSSGGTQGRSITTPASSSQAQRSAQKPWTQHPELHSETEVQGEAQLQLSPPQLATEFCPPPGHCAWARAEEAHRLAPAIAANIHGEARHGVRTVPSTRPPLDIRPTTRKTLARRPGAVNDSVGAPPAVRHSTLGRRSPAKLRPEPEGGEAAAQLTLARDALRGGASSGQIRKGRTGFSLPFTWIAPSGTRG